MKISINLIATNKYMYFLEDVANSIDKFFFRDCEITVIVHTNLDIPETFSKYTRIKFVKNPIVHEEWPAPTLKRFSYFMSAKDFIESTDYSFYIDVDSIFIKDIDKTILPEEGMIGTIHPCLYNTTGTPDRNRESKAYIPHGSFNRYFCGGFFGGDSKSFLQFSDTLRNNIEIDLSKNIVAIWHDESHLNRFFYDTPPLVTLEYPFAVAETLQTPSKNSSILFLDKRKIGGSAFFRT